jgi:hypothetical protein
MRAQQEQRSPARIVSGAGSLKIPGKRGGADFSPRPRQRACQDPLTRQGGDALTDTKNTHVMYDEIGLNTVKAPS